LAISQTINDPEINLETITKIVNEEIEDLTDILDNLSTEFKSTHQMEMSKEEKREVLSKDLLKIIKRTHLRLA